MALRDQPYIPLYVQDYLTDEKLNMCSLESQGAYIKIMCLMHKSEKYGTILLKQKDKQKESTCLNFAYKIAKLLPISLETLEKVVCELIEEDVLQISGDELQQKRMIKDGELSLKRSKAGKKGGNKTKFANSFAQANIKANSEYENEYENNISNTGIKNSKAPDTLEFVQDVDIQNTPHIVFSKEDLRIELNNSYVTVEEVMRLHQLKEHDVTKHIKDFCDTIEPEELDKPFWEIRKHFKNWVKYHKVKETKNNKNGTVISKGEQRDKNRERQAGLLKDYDRQQA